MNVVAFSIQHLYSIKFFNKFKSHNYIIYIVHEVGLYKRFWVVFFKDVKHRDIIPESFGAFRFQNYYLYNSFVLGGQRTLRGNVV